MKTPESNNSPQKAPRAAHIQRADRLHVVVNDPFLDWLIILILAFVTVLTLVAVGASVYLDTGARLSTPPPAAHRSGMSKVNTEMLGDILEEFDARARERALPARAFSAPKDPSLP